MLPTISLSAMRSDNSTAKALVAEQFREACLDRGFLYIVDHGVPPALIADVLTQSKLFFDQPMNQKRAVHKARSFCNRGYEPLQDQILEAGAPPDLKEGFYIGTDLPLDDPRVVAGVFNQGPNQWPEGFEPTALVRWRATMEAYFQAMSDLCVVIMRALALSLGLPEGHFAAFCTDPIATLRLLHYPPQPANPLPNEKGCGAHTDFGAITILLQDDAGGLQVFDQDHGWIDAPPVAGSYVVNLGDLIARWTNDRYRSTLHRVVNRSGRERYSAPFFYTGNADHRVTCLPTCLDPGEQPKYPSTTPAGHLTEMYQRTYGGA
jgi:isopenicillin N synthase-like dioxygenase